MKIAERDVLKVFLVVSLGFYLSLIGFGSSLVMGREAGLESSMAGNIVNQLTGLSLLALCCFFIAFSKKVSFKTVIAIGWPIWLLLAYFAFSISWSYSPAISIRRVIALTSMALTCCLLAMIYSPRSLLTMIAQTIVLIAFIGLVYSILAGKPLSFGLSDRASGFRGIFSDKNGAARVYTYGFLLFIGLKLYTTKFGLACLLFLGFAILLSQSATAVVMASFGSGLIILFRMFRGKDIQANLLKFVALLLVLLIGAYIVNVAYELILELLGRDLTLTNRAIIWELLGPLIENEWLFGYGYGAFWVSDGAVPFIERWGFIGNAHSGYKEAILHGGVVGLCMLAFVFIYQLIKAIKLYITPSSTSVSPFLLMIVLLQLVVNYIAYIVLNHNSVDMFLYFICFFITIYQASASDKSVGLTEY